MIHEEATHREVARDAKGGEDLGKHRGFAVSFFSWRSFLAPLRADSDASVGVTILLPNCCREIAARVLG